jgi:small conductance mechanosensitive channel
LDIVAEELDTLKNAVNAAVAFIVNYGFQFIGAIIILIAGWWVARWCGGLMLRFCQGAGLDVTLSRFFANVVKTLVLIFVVIVALNNFGVSIAPFVAAVGAVAFGATLAFQGTLSNYGAGLTIILARPFVVGDTIRVGAVTGVVEDIKLGYTLLSNEDGELITVPNNQIIGQIIHNSRAYRVVELAVGIDYRSDPERAVSVIRDILDRHADIAREPAPQVGIANFGDSGFEIGVRYWIPAKRYFQLQYAINLSIHEALKAARITIPYPQREVRIIEQKS